MAVCILCASVQGRRIWTDPNLAAELAARGEVWRQEPAGFDAPGERRLVKRGQGNRTMGFAVPLAGSWSGSEFVVRPGSFEEFVACWYPENGEEEARVSRFSEFRRPFFINRW